NSMGWTSDAHATADATEQVVLDLGASRRAGSVELHGRTDQTGGQGAGFAQDFTVEVSADGVHWTKITDQHGYVRPAGSTTGAFSFTEQDVRFVRVVMTKLGAVNEGSTVYRAQFAEIVVR
ncbi:hypothetical protein UK23_31030, partial [Lentzea aerocolonigenes]